LANLQAMLEYNVLVKPFYQITDEARFDFIVSGRAVDGTYKIPASMASSGEDEYIDMGQGGR